MTRHPLPISLALYPYLPRPAPQPLASPSWVHEIKHDGFRILARRDERGVRLFTRNGYDFTSRFPRIADAINNLSVGSCLIDGEAIVVGTTGPSAAPAVKRKAEQDWGAKRST